MTTRLTRTRSVLHLLDSDEHTGTYGRSPEEVADGAAFRNVQIARSDIEDLGVPEQITVTIYPGDLLNVPAPDSVQSWLDDLDLVSESDW